MLKTLGNLLTILLICVIASGVSINASPLLDKSLIATADEEPSITVNLVSDVQNNSIKNPKNINIQHKATGPITLNFYDNYVFSAIIYRNSEIYKHINLVNISDNTPTSIELSKDTPYSTNIDLSQETLNLPNGNYKISINSNAMEIKYTTSPIEFDVTYIGDYPYVPASNEGVKGKMPVTLYFSDKEAMVDELIAVTRFIDYSSKPQYRVIEELQKGPLEDTGLSTYSPIGEVIYASHKGNTIYVNLPSDEKKYTDGSCQTGVAMTSFLKSFTSLKGVTKVKFLVDGKTAEAFFHDRVIDKPFDKDVEDRAYLAFNSYQRYFLVDSNVESITEEDDINVKVGKILEALKETKFYSLSNTIPKEVNVIDFSINNATLTLNFSSDFLTSFNENRDLQRMMIDSILFSFTSIKGINNVSILVEGNTVESFAGVELSKPLSRPLYINPESILQ